MKCYVIDAKEGVIYEREYTPYTNDINDILGCSIFCVGGYLNDKADAVLVDDEGLLKNPEHFFQIGIDGQPLAGHGVVTGCDAHGDPQGPTISIEELAAMGVYKANPLGGSVVWALTPMKIRR